MSTSQKNVEDVPLQSEGKPDLDKIAQSVQSMFKFKHFYDQVDFSAEKRLVITKTIIDRLCENCALVEKSSRRKNRFKDGVAVFYHND